MIRSTLVSYACQKIVSHINDAERFTMIVNGQMLNGSTSTSSSLGDLREE